MQWLSEQYFLRTGWTFVGEVPDEPRLVIIGYPHTSNWDFFVFLAVARHFRLQVRFLAHSGLFIGPFGWLLRRWGAIEVLGDAGTRLSTLVQTFEAAESMTLVLAPEGTRASGSKWRSGFWRIADTVDAPVLMGFVDRSTKRLGFGPAIRINGDPHAWMADARLFYGDKRGIKPDKRGPIELGQ